jgi:hypothetical protein
MYEMEGAPRTPLNRAGSDRSGATVLRDPVTATVTFTDTGFPMSAGSRSSLRSRSPWRVT